MSKKMCIYCISLITLSACSGEIGHLNGNPFGNTSISPPQDSSDMAADAAHIADSIRQAQNTSGTTPLK